MFSDFGGCLAGGTSRRRGDAPISTLLDLSVNMVISLSLTVSVYVFVIVAFSFLRSQPTNQLTRPRVLGGGGVFHHHARTNFPRK